jgi:hypothetical protein
MTIDEPLRRYCAVGAVQRLRSVSWRQIPIDDGGVDAVQSAQSIARQVFLLEVNAPIAAARKLREYIFLAL